MTQSIQYSLDHRPEAVDHALQYARDMGRDLADRFVGMYVNDWTLDYGEKAVKRFDVSWEGPLTWGSFPTARNWNLCPEQGAPSKEQIRS